MKELLEFIIVLVIMSTGFFLGHSAAKEKYQVTSITTHAPIQPDLIIKVNLNVDNDTTYVYRLPIK